MSLPVATSPCIGVCKLTPAGICAGCGRLLAEIAAWTRMTDEERQEVRKKAAGRLEGCTVTSPAADAKG